MVTKMGGARQKPFQLSLANSSRKSLKEKKPKIYNYIQKKLLFSLLPYVQFFGISQNYFQVIKEKTRIILFNFHFWPFLKFTNFCIEKGEVRSMIS